MKEKVKFAFHVLTHPFDGFWDLKREGKGSLLLAFIFIFLWILSNVITQEVTSFLFNETALQLVDISVEIQKVLVVFSFLRGQLVYHHVDGGRGFLQGYCHGVGYSCLPLSLINIPLAFLSLVFTYSESVYYSALSILAGVWFFFLLFTGIMTVHQYTVMKMVATSILTVLAMLALVFIYLLFFKLISQFSTFVLAIYQELSYRI